MSQLADWLQIHHTDIIEATTRRFAEVGGMGGHQEATIFLQQLLNAVENGNSMPFLNVIEQWVLPLEGSSTRLLTLLSIQSDLRLHVLKNMDTQAAIQIITTFDNIFTLAIAHFNQLEMQAHQNAFQKELARKLDEIQRLDKHKSDFIAVAAHELKTPLTLIEGYANMLKGDFPEEDYKRASSLLRGIMNGTLRLREIIEDMIDVSLIDMEAFDLNTQPVWLAQLLEMAVGEMRKIAKDRQVNILLQPAGLPKTAILADPERLFQAFGKIIENGIKYTPDQGRIAIFGKTYDDRVEVMIRDTGIGIDPDDQDVIFEKFFSLGQVGLHSSSKTKFKGGGPGLGLAIARGIIEAHGGKIWVESEGYSEEELHGSCFYVMLPLHNIDHANYAEPIPDTTS